MADRVLMFSWGETARGREERAIEVFNESIGMYGQMQQDGRIESFDVTLLEPSGDLQGYVQLHGSEEQINAIAGSEDFMRLVADAQMIVDDVRLRRGATGQAVADQIAIFQEAVSKVPQMA